MELFDKLDERTAGLIERRDALVSYMRDTHHMVQRELQAIEREIHLVQPVASRGRLEIDTQQQVVKWDGNPVQVYAALFQLVDLLSRYPGVVYSRDQIMDGVLGNEIVDDRSIDARVKRIRRAFKAVDPDFDQIGTVYGAGYFWRPD